MGRWETNKILRILYSKWTNSIIRGFGLSLLFGYLLASQDLTFSFHWALVQVFIVFGISILFSFTNTQYFFPSLNKYHIHSVIDETDISHPKDDNDYAEKQLDYTIGLFDKKSFFFTSAEDGLICVPVLLIGIDPLTAMIAGLVFAWIHIPKFTYFECILKGLSYGLVCLIVLPYGLLTVVLGHYLINGLGFFALKTIKKLYISNESE